ncbi:hypothetical protein ACFY7C_20370 [Streptomyces sp. NPDC012769]|uniref:hypothetical protein n=1 Tax=Streptomyces sp. NPDC012769 TaxID=3364848 RepID=UPI00368300D5
MTMHTLLRAAALAALPLFLVTPAAAHADGPSGLGVTANDVNDAAGALAGPDGLGLDGVAHTVAGHPRHPGH